MPNAAPAKKQPPTNKGSKQAPRPSPTKPAVKAPVPASAAVDDDDDLPPLIPPEVPAAEPPLQPILVDLSPRAAVAPAEAPAPKQPVVKNDKGTTGQHGLPCAWSVTGCPLDTNPPRGPECPPCHSVRPRVCRAESGVGLGADTVPSPLQGSARCLQAAVTNSVFLGTEHGVTCVGVGTAELSWLHAGTLGRAAPCCAQLCASGVGCGFPTVRPPAERSWGLCWCQVHPGLLASPSNLQRPLSRAPVCVVCAETLSREGDRPELRLQLHERVLSSPCSLLCGLETHSSALCTPARQGKLCSVLEGTMHCSSGAGAGGEANLSVQNAVFDESFPTKYRSFCHQITEGCSSPKDLVDWALVPCRVSAPAVPAAEQV